MCSRPEGWQGFRLKKHNPDPFRGSIFKSDEPPRQKDANSLSKGSKRASASQLRLRKKLVMFHIAQTQRIFLKK